MEPITTGLVIGGTTGLAQGLSSLFQLGAQREAERRKTLADAAQGAYQMRRQAIGKELEREQTALQDIINAYRSTIGL